MAPQVFVAATANGVVRAARCAGSPWTVETILLDQPVRALAVDPVESGVLHAGTDGGGVLRSDDAGVTWQPAGMPGATITALAVSPLVPGRVYAGTRPVGMWVSEDRGERWAQLAPFPRRSRWFWFSPAEKPFTAYVQGIALSPTDPDVLVAGIEFGAVLRSADGGQSWSGHRRRASRDCHSLTFHASDGNWVYEGGGTGPAVSRNGGTTWSRPRSGLDRRYAWAVAADPGHPEIWYCSASPSPKKAHGDGTAEAFIFRSLAGDSWRKLSGGLPQPLSHMPYALVTDRAVPGHLYAGLSNGDVWRTTDCGDSWEQLPFNLGGIHRNLVLLNV